MTKGEISRVNEAFETRLPTGNGDAAAIAAPPRLFHSTSGEADGNPVTRYSGIEHTELTLRKEDESYLIFLMCHRLSNQRDAHCAGCYSNLHYFG